MIPEDENINMTEEEYNETYREGSPHSIPEDVLEEALRNADRFVASLEREDNEES